MVPHMGQGTEDVAIPTKDQENFKLVGLPCLALLNKF